MNSPSEIQFQRWSTLCFITTAAILALLAIAVPGGDSRSSGSTQAKSANSSGLHEMNRADCRQTIIGIGRPGWRKTHIVSGPVAVLKRPLSHINSEANGLTTKMPLLILGHRSVRISAPRKLRNRVFLYYGIYRDRHGRRTTGFAEAHGHSATEFQPCAQKPRSAFPGGVRIRGRKPVRLRIDVEGESRPHFLNLGRPKLYRPLRR